MCLRSICGRRVVDRVRNSLIRERCEYELSLLDTVERNVLKWFGHVESIEEEVTDCARDVCGVIWLGKGNINDSERRSEEIRQLLEKKSVMGRYGCSWLFKKKKWEDYWRWLRDKRQTALTWRKGKTDYEAQNKQRIQPRHGKPKGKPDNSRKQEEPHEPSNDRV